MGAAAEKPTYNLNNPFHAKLVENRLLNKHGTTKETRHLVVDISGSGITYECGDSLGVFPTNRDVDIEHMLSAVGATGEELVEVPKVDGKITYREALHERLYYLSGPTKRFLEAIREKAEDENEQKRLDHFLNPANAQACQDFLAERHYADILESFPSAKFTPQETVKLFKRLVPRLYSIASSPTKYPDHIHLTIAAVRYELLGRERVGVGSTFGIDRVPLNEPQLPVFVSSSHFGLPESDEVDIIMIGPGTGVAPFRAFLQEREARGAKGRNWLFFGEQKRNSDFLYEDDMVGWEKSGHLTHLDCAWSRDQEEKVYVQHLLWNKRDEFWRWWENGAILYVCGDKARMSRDVEDVFVKIAQENGAVGEDEKEIKQWIKAQKKAGRYQLDVY